MFSKDSTIGIIGLGATGDGLRQHFGRLAQQVRVFDPQRVVGSLRDVNEAELIFVCVPKPYQPPRDFDTRALDDVVSLLDGPKVIVITSNVLPGTTEAFQCRYPQHGFLVNPQFGDTEPRRQIVGYTAQSRHLAEAVLALLPDAPHRRVLPAREAELARCITIAFLATRLVLASEARDLCLALDADYAAVRDALADLPPSLAENDAGDELASLAADTDAILTIAADLGVPLRLLRAAAEINASPSGDEPAAEQPQLDSGRWLQVLAPDPDAGEQAA